MEKNIKYQSIKNNMDKARVIILGADGYIGVALYELLKDNNYFVLGVDNNKKDQLLRETGTESLTHNRKYANFNIDISTQYKDIKEIINSIRPNVIVNLAQIPSAPWSMMSADKATDVQRNNICGALNIYWAVKEIDPSIHIMQLATAGEFPDWLYPDYLTIPEGSRVNVRYNDRDWEIPLPRYGGSWYHQAKTHASLNADYANRIWGLKITDICQGIVYGHYEGSSFHYDSTWGTVYNRFITQAVVGVPLTIYGKGGQMRSFINIKNSIGAIKLLIDNPPQDNEFRVVHQITELYRVEDVANMIQNETHCQIQHIENPRAEQDTNDLKFEANKLKTLGLETIHMRDEIPKTLEVIKEHKSKINKETIMPIVQWK